MPIAFASSRGENRAAFVTTALVAAALVIGSIASVWQAVRAWRAEATAEAQRNEAESQSRRAEANFQKARQAIDNYVVLIRDNELLSEANYQPLRQELLASTLAYYRQFVEQYRDDPTLQPELGLAYIRIGQITTDAGTRDQACDLMKQGVEVYQRLCLAAPDNQDYQQTLGKALNSLASLARDCGRAAESVQASAQAIAKGPASAILKDQNDRSKQNDPSMLENLHFTKELGHLSQAAAGDRQP